MPNRVQSMVDPFSTPTYRAQVKTAAVAWLMIPGSTNVTKGNVLDMMHTTPYCLRLRKAYRTEADQAFRDKVAQEVRRRRKL